MTSSTKSEAHNITCRNFAIGEPSHGHSQHAQNLAKFGCVVLKICEPTDRQTDRQKNINTHDSTSHLSQGWSTKKVIVWSACV